MTPDEMKRINERLDKWAAEAGAKYEGGGVLDNRVSVVRFRRLDQSWMVRADEFSARALAGENPFLPPFKDLYDHQ
jgi:hypothetical protein